MFLLNARIIAKLSYISCRVRKSLLDYRDVFFRSLFCDAFLAIVDLEIPVFPFIQRLFFRRRVNLSVKAMVFRC